MKHKNTVVLPLATALAALTTAANATAPTTPPADKASNPSDSQRATVPNFEPNTFYRAGDDLMGLLVTRSADGTIIAQHFSHSSHASHASHTSHASSRY